MASQFSRSDDAMDAGGIHRGGERGRSARGERIFRDVPLSGGGLQTAHSFPYSPDLSIQSDQVSVSGYLHDRSRPVRRGDPVVHFEGGSPRSLSGGIQGTIDLVAAFKRGELGLLHSSTPRHRDRVARIVGNPWRVEAIRRSVGSFRRRTGGGIPGIGAGCCEPVGKGSKKSSPTGRNCMGQKWNNRTG